MATYYVDQTGNNTADGTSYLNRASVAYHNAGSGVFASLAGDTVILTGTITSEVQVPDSGSSGSVITYDGDDGVNPACTIDRNGGAYGFTIGNGSSFARSYVTVQDLIVTDFADLGILIHGSAGGGVPHDIIVKRCTIHTALQKGISVSDNSWGNNRPYNITIGGASGDGNTIYNIGNDTRGMDVNTSYAHDVIISYNHLYANNTDYGIDGIHLIEGYNQLIEYNTVHGHNNNTGGQWGENCVDIKGGSYNIIVRFNRFYDNDHEPAVIMQTVRGGPGDANNTHDIYIYGNSIYETQNAVAIYVKEGYYVNDIHVWANLIYDNSNWGISIAHDETSGNTVSNLYVYNNVFAENAPGVSPVQLSFSGFRYYDLAGTNRLIKNNIFYKNRPDATDYRQRHSNATGDQTFDYNQYYWPGHTSYVYWSGADRTIATLQDSYGQEIKGADSDPGFTNAGTNVFTLQSTSPCINNGADLSGLAGSLTIHDTIYNMYYDDCLDPNNTDFSTVPPTVQTLKQNEHGTGWDQGAYVYAESTVLTSGIPKAGSVALGQWSYYQIDAIASHTQIVAELTGLSSDVDLYVRDGALPNLNDYDCRPWLEGASSEICTLPNSGSTTWYIGVYGYNAGSYTIEATLSIALLTINGNNSQVNYSVFDGQNENVIGIAVGSTYSGTKIQNVTVVRCGETGISAYSDVELSNTILYNDSGDDIFISSSTTVSANGDNYIQDSGKTGTGIYSTGSYTTTWSASDPFRRYTVNLNLDIDSYCINTGNNSVWLGNANITDADIEGITDSEGNIISPGDIIDIGAYERYWKEKINDESPTKIIGITKRKIGRIMGLQ